MDEDLRFSAQGSPQWFSPRHAGEKFHEICVSLAILAGDADRAKKKRLSAQLWALADTADGYAKYYFQKSPVQSVRVMEPTGAIFVILADGREVLVPQASAAKSEAAGARKGPAGKRASRSVQKMRIVPKPED